MAGEKDLLVKQNIAAWGGIDTLVTGYILRSNPKIYKSIFQKEREKHYFKVRDELKKYGRFIVAGFRETLYFKTLMNISELNILPKFIIMIIANFTYDPVSYLKL